MEATPNPPMLEYKRRRKNPRRMAIMYPDAVPSAIAPAR